MTAAIQIDFAAARRRLDIVRMLHERTPVLCVEIEPTLVEGDAEILKRWHEQSATVEEVDANQAHDEWARDQAFDDGLLPHHELINIRTVHHG